MKTNKGKKLTNEILHKYEVNFSHKSHKTNNLNQYLNQKMFT
jgi:hypothetical protein